MKTIPEDFKPDANTLNLLRKRGIFEDFCNHILDDFLIYWNDPEIKKTKKGKKASWQKTFYTWAVRSFQGKPGREWEENKHRRSGNGGIKTDLFEGVLDSITAREKGDRAPTGAAHMKVEPPDMRELDQAKGGRELQERDLTGPDNSRSIIRNPIPGANQTMTFEQAQEELKKMKIIS